MTVNGEQNYIRNFSIGKTVIYRAVKDKTIDAMKKLRFLEKFTGVLVHDHETALYHFGTAHKYAKEDEAALLNRLEKYSHNHLLFLYDFAVPFDDNLSERDLRKAKNRQKMAGGFRKESGHEMYCNILSVIETLKRRNMGIIENVKQLFMKHRLYSSRCNARWFSWNAEL